MTRFSLAALLATGCALDAQTPPIDNVEPPGDGAITCADAEYGDGTCHIDLACGMPDPDCFVQFGSDEEAATAMASKVPTLYPGSTHYAAARAQLDRSWELFKARHPMGTLADKHLAVVLVAKPTVNAFVYPGTAPGSTHFAVFIHTGTFDAGMTPEQLDGLMFHELSHLANHHAAEEVRTRTRRYYVAPADGEPIGAGMTDDADARELISAWRAMAKYVGPYTTPDLLNLPFGGYAEYLFQYFYEEVAIILPRCTNQAYEAMDATRNVGFNRLDQSLIIDSLFQYDAQSAITALEQCIGPYFMTFKDLREKVATNAPWMVEWLTSEDAELDTTDALDGLRALMANRRAQMLALQSQFVSKTQRPWSAARFYSIEEQADDEATHLTTALGRDEIGTNGLLRLALGDSSAACDAAIASGTVPYGVNLYDEHHGTCWRIDHALAVRDQVKARSRHLPRARTPWIPTMVSTEPLY